MKETLCSLFQLLKVRIKEDMWYEFTNLTSAKTKVKMQIFLTQNLGSLPLLDLYSHCSECQISSVITFLLLEKLLW